VCTSMPTNIDVVDVDSEGKTNGFDNEEVSTTVVTFADDC